MRVFFSGKGEKTKMSYFRTKMDYSGPNLDYISCALHARSNMKITAPSPFLRSSPHPKISGMIFFFSAIQVTFSSSFFLLRAKKILGSPTQKTCEPACQVLAAAHSRNNSKISSPRARISAGYASPAAAAVAPEPEAQHAST